MAQHAWSELPEPRSKADLVYEKLREAIVGGEIRPGERVNMDEVARAFGVSKIPVREAVKRLESEGLVVSRVHAGVVVAQVDAREMRGVFLAREAIEGLVGRLAAEVDDEALVPELERIQAAMRAALSGGETTGLAELNSQFHQTLATATGYRILGQLTEQLLSTVRRFRVAAPHDEASWRLVVTEHEAIIDALRGGDPAGVEAAVRAHTLSQAGHEVDRS